MNINDAALRYLGTMSRTKLEMKRHLDKKGFDADDIDRVIAEFTEMGYLNDMKYCHEYFRYAFGKGKGKNRVFQELQSKGIDRETIEIAFDDAQYEGELEYDEVDRARKEADKVLRLCELENSREIPEKYIRRIAGRLQSKGYSGDTIYKIIGELRR